MSGAITFTPTRTLTDSEDITNAKINEATGGAWRIDEDSVTKSHLSVAARGGAVPSAIINYDFSTDTDGLNGRNHFLVDVTNDRTFDLLSDHLDFPTDADGVGAILTIRRLNGEGRLRIRAGDATGTPDKVIVSVDGSTTYTSGADAGMDLDGDVRLVQLMYVGKNNTLLFDTITRGVRWVEVRREVAAVPAEEVLTYTWDDWGTPIQWGTVIVNTPLNGRPAGLGYFSATQTDAPGGNGISNGGIGVVYTFEDGRQIASRIPGSLPGAGAFYRQNKNGGTWVEWDDASNPIPSDLITDNIDEPAGPATITYYPATGFPDDSGITATYKVFAMLVFSTEATSQSLYGGSGANGQVGRLWTRTGTQD